METQQITDNWRLGIGGVINVALWSAPLLYLSAGYMDVAAHMIGEPVSWPQISFMSAYPADVRNGYLLFVAAVYTTILLFSGLLAGAFAASPGKALLGVRYVALSGSELAFAAFLKRAAAQCALLSLVLLPGPILGFIFGTPAVLASLFCLLAATGFASWALFPSRGRPLSPMNTWTTMKPINRDQPA